MSRAGAIGLVLAVTVPAFANAAPLVVRDAVYRGTMVCAKLPFFEKGAREAIEVTIAGGTVRYTHTVREIAGASNERGRGTLADGAITLAGSWHGTKDSYDANYAGSFVRRSAKLTGTQRWNHQGGVFTRTCTGVIKRPLAAFLPNKGPQPAKNDDDEK
jgi:hypothetical protein